jgi:hypothetical protein
MERKVKLIRLLSGEELITEVISNRPRLLLSDSVTAEQDSEEFSKGPVTIKNPLAIIARDDGQGNMGLTFQPWIVFRDKEPVMTIRETALVYVIEADPKLVKQYNDIIDKMTGKTIQVAQGVPSQILRG